jgi:hypothetical protein
VPEGYEEQMMLAMALSLADAQARIHWNGGFPHTAIQVMCNSNLYPKNVFVHFF